ncbi:MAG TPA: glycosyltransferase family 2 protein, partial [Micromonosporaceae bacterium]
YYAVKRDNAQNITYASRFEERLRCAEELVGFVAGLIEPGPRRDAVLVRHFSWEVAKLIEDDFLRLDRPTQERVHAVVGELARRYLTDGIRRRLAVESRLRILAAAQGDLDQLLAVIRQDARHGVPVTVVSGARWYAAYPGAVIPAPDEPVIPAAEQPVPTAPAWSDVTEVAAGWTAKLDATTVAWAGGGRTLTITARSPRPDLAALLDTPIRVTAGTVSGQSTLAADPAGTIVQAEFAVRELVADAAPLGGRRNLRAEVSLGQDTGSAPLRAPRLARPRPLVRRNGARLYALTVNNDASGHLMIAITPVTVRRVMARVRRMWVQRGR